MFKIICAVIFIILFLFLAKFGLLNFNSLKALTLEPSHFSKKDPPPNFVTVKNGHFVVNGKIIRFAGTTAYYLPNYKK